MGVVSRVNALMAGGAVFLLGVGSAFAFPNDQASVRRPLGVFAHLDIEVVIQDVINANAGVALTPDQLHSDLRQVYAQLLANPAISGITAGRHWDHIQLADPSCVFNASCPAGSSDGYDWSYVDDVFAEANAVHKSVQLLITPGVNSPQWLLDKIPSCDGLFTGTGLAPFDCGKATFSNFPEEMQPERADGDVLPLPWNPIYIAAWDDFLVHLSARYGPNPAFTYIAVAGPVCDSTEMILPTSADGSTQASGLPSDKAWDLLIRHSFPFLPSYYGTDQAFIDAWTQTIFAFERIFSGVTLVISPDAGNGLPEFPNPVYVHPENFLFTVDCASAPNNQMSCEAKTDILSNFVFAWGPNEKGSQVGGMTASTSTSTGDLGLAGVKVLTALPWPLTPILGGAEFDHPVSDQNTVQAQGCPSGHPNCQLTAEDAAYNTFQVFFFGTPGAMDFGSTPGPSPVQYVELDQSDVVFAEQEQCPIAPNKIPGNPSLQDLLNLASYDLFTLAGKPTVLPPPTCP